MTETLKNLLARSSSAIDVDALPAKLAALLNTYDNSKQIHPQFRADIFQFLTSAISLAAAMAEPEYDAEQVRAAGMTIISLTPQFVRQAEKSQMTRPGFTIFNRSTRLMLPQVFNSQQEASTYLAGLGAFIDLSEVEIVQVSVALTLGAPPSATPAQTVLPRPTLQANSPLTTPAGTTPPPLQNAVPEPPTAFPERPLSSPTVNNTDLPLTTTKPEGESS